MNTLIYLRVFLFSIFLFIGFTSKIICQKTTVNLIWISQFENKTDLIKDTLLLVDGPKVLARQLEEMCIELCCEKKLEIYFQKSQDTLIIKEKNKLPIVYQRIENKITNDLNTSGNALIVITTKYTEFDDYYNITSYIDKYGAENAQEIIPYFKLFKSNELITNKDYSLLRTHAESIANILYKLNQLQFSKTIYPQPLTYPDSLSRFNDAPELILSEIIKITGGKKITEGMSDKSDAILEVNLTHFPKEVMISVAIKFLEEPQYNAYSRGSFAKDSLSSYLKSIDKIVEELAKQINEKRY